jgi:hypothetical protein
VHEAEGDLYLCPSVRLLADTPGACSYVYDGKGHRLVLPDKQHLGEKHHLGAIYIAVCVTDARPALLCLRFEAVADGCWVLNCCLAPCLCCR